MNVVKIANGVLFFCLFFCYLIVVVYLSFSPSSSSSSGSNPSKKAVLLSSQFLHNELPIRVARRVLQLEEMPLSFSQMPSILELKDRYIETFQDLLNFPVMNLESADLSNKIVYSLGATETSKMFRQSDLKALSDDLADTLDENGQKRYEQITKNFLGLLDEVKKRHDDGKQS